MSFTEILCNYFNNDRDSKHIVNIIDEYHILKSIDNELDSLFKKQEILNILKNPFLLLYILPLKTLQRLSREIEPILIEKLDEQDWDLINLWNDFYGYEKIKSINALQLFGSCLEKKALEIRFQNPKQYLHYLTLSWSISQTPTNNFYLGLYYFDHAKNHTKCLEYWKLINSNDLYNFIIRDPLKNT